MSKPNKPLSKPSKANPSETSPRVASIASKVLKDPKEDARAKSVAASALEQAARHKKK